MTAYVRFHGRSRDYPAGAHGVIHVPSRTTILHGLTERDARVAAAWLNKTTVRRAAA